MFHLLQGEYSLTWMFREGGGISGMARLPSTLLVGALDEGHARFGHLPTYLVTVDHIILSLSMVWCSRQGLGFRVGGGHARTWKSYPQSLCRGNLTDYRFGLIEFSPSKTMGVSLYRSLFSPFVRI